MNRLDALFAPRGIAVIGASRDPGKLGAVMARSLRRFPGTVVGVNARDADPAAGRFATVADAAAASADPVVYEPGGDADGIYERFLAVTGQTAKETVP